MDFVGAWIPLQLLLPFDKYPVDALSIFGARHALDLKHADIGLPAIMFMAMGPKR
ncbi:hypothetical protein D3C86_339180 [compost metagenome]